MKQKSLLPAVLCFFVFGILSFQLKLNPSFWIFVLVLVSLVFLFIVHLFWGFRIVLLLLIVFCIGFIRTEITQKPVNPLFLQQNKTLEIKGEISSDPVYYKSSCYFKLQTEKQEIWIKTIFEPDDLEITKHKLLYHSFVQCSGITGFTDSMYRTEKKYSSYLNQKRCNGSLTVQNNDIKILRLAKTNRIQNYIQKMQNQIQSNIEKSIPNTEISDFLIAIFLGKTSGKSYRQERYSEIGIAHMMAISGANFSILASCLLLILLLLKLKTPYREFVVLSFLFLYLIMIGFIPSACRSFIMISLAILAPLLKRVYNPSVALCFAILCMLLFNPWLITDIGFQLSVLGALAFSLPISYLSKGLTATLITSLLVAYQFHLFSLSSFLANWILFPFLPILYITSFFVGLGFPFFSWMVFLIGIVWKIFRWITGFLSLLPLSYRYITSFPVWILIVFYGFLFVVFLFHFYSDTRYSFQIVKKTLLILLLLPPFILFLPTYKSRLALIEFIDVGQGDSILIRIPEGKTILIDGGKGITATNSFNTGEEVVLPVIKSLGINQIDFAILSHYHDDHYGGLLSILTNVPKVKLLIIPATKSADSEQFDFLYNRLARKPLKIETICGRKRIVLSEKCYLDFFAPDCDPASQDSENENNRSIVFKFNYGNTSILFPGDLDGSKEEELAKKYGDILRSTILKAGHHGSLTSTTQAFLDFVMPERVIISSGLERIFNHPSPQTLNRLNENNIPYLITQKFGDIILFSDGTQFSKPLEEID